MIATRFRLAMHEWALAAFADEPNDDETQRLYAIVEREYAALPWPARKYADFLVWRANRAIERVLHKHGITA